MDILLKGFWMFLADITIIGLFVIILHVRQFNRLEKWKQRSSVSHEDYQTQLNWLKHTTRDATKTGLLISFVGSLIYIGIIYLIS